MILDVFLAIINTLRGIFIVLHWLGTHLIIDIVVLGAIAALIAIANYKKLVDSGMLIAQKSSEKIVYRKCKACKGRCVVMLDGSPIPDEHLSVRHTAEGMIWDGRIANTKNCPDCQGLGSVWIDQDNSRRNNSVDRRWYD